MRLDRPIFLVGTGRCGSTIVHKIFTYHPEVSFLSGLCLLYPDQPKYNRWAMQLMDVPLVRNYARKKFQPAEHWPFWDRYVRGFSFPCRDLVADDVRPIETAHMTGVLQQMLTARRQRLLAKLTGWPRIGFLQRMFPGAHFIHVVRDGRAVVNSLLNVDFWRGWGGPALLGLGELTVGEQAEWDRSEHSFVVLAAIQWKRWMDAFEAAKQEVPPAQYLEIRYEDFTADPAGTFNQVLAFCGLSSPAEFFARVRQFRVKSENNKWREQLTAAQQQQLEESLHEHLLRYGYDTVPEPAGGR
ncbi:MAG TPA: sulfotransferase [Pirellulales bacterium]|nr:sulfotransferase [Pirellulales bacterium]